MTMAMGSSSVWSNSATIQLPIGPLGKGPLIAMDIGGSLLKMAYIKTDEEISPHGLVSVHLRTCDISRLDCAMKFIKQIINESDSNNKLSILATGVGSFKYQHVIQDNLDVKFATDSDEVLHASTGLDLLWRYLPKEDLLFEPVPSLQYECTLKDSGLGVFVLLSVGSALHIAKVNPSESQVKTVGGGITAGLSFLGLGRLLSDETSFASMLALADNGDRHTVDLFVSDTAGPTGYNSMPQSCDASSFGRIANSNDSSEFSRCDLLASLLYNVCDRIGLVIHLVSQNLALRSDDARNLKYAIFYGSFLTNNPSGRQILKEKINSCSSSFKFDLQPIFVRYEQYLGALGVLHKIIAGHKVDCE